MIPVVCAQGEPRKAFLLPSIQICSGQGSPGSQKPGSRKIILSRRGAAREKGVWKIKWRMHDMRIFFHYNAEAGVVTFLDIQSKSGLVKAGEEIFYDELAGRVDHLAALEFKGDSQFKRRMKRAIIQVDGARIERPS